MKSDPFKNKHVKKGALAEKMVQEKFVRQGFRILASNYRHVGFEIDLIAQKAHTIVFVEIKYRSSIPSVLVEILPPQKKRALIKGARHYLASYRCDQSFTTARFDLVIFMPKKGFVYFPHVLEL